MKIKKEYIVLILIIIGLSVYLFMRSSGRTLYQVPQLDGLKKSEITKIEISHGGNSVILKKKDNQWYLEPTGFLADKIKVNAMLSVFEDLTLTALVSESKDYNRYDLDAEKRITVKAWQQETLKRNFDIGKAAPSFRHTFVKLGDDSRVFHARDNFRGKFDFTIDSLRDKTVLSFKTADIRQVEIIKPPASLKLIRNEVPVTPAAGQQQKTETAPAAAVKFEWQNENGEKGNDRNLNRLLTTLGDLKCADYINDRQKDAFSAPIYTVKLKGIKDYQLEIFAKLQKDDKKYPAVSSDSDYPFWVTDNQAQQIMINPEEMIKKPK
ncbi:MAG: DUF4340 domain-containing protein [Desulfobacterales bacterium]|jgi:hypothetical protein